MPTREESKLVASRVRTMLLAIGLEMEDFVKIAVNNGIGFTCAIFVMWVSWYRETKTLPKILDNFTQLTREERSNYQRWHEENRDRLDRIIADQREQRHYSKNLAHLIGMKQAMDEEMRKEKPDPND